MACANCLHFIPCPKVSNSLILLFGIIIFAVSSRMYAEVTGVSKRSLISTSGAASAGDSKRVSQ